MLYKYLAIAFGATILYDHIPNDKLPIKERLPFVLFAVLLFYFFDTSYLKQKFLEKFDEMVNPVGIASADRQTEITKLEAELDQLKDSVPQSFAPQTDPSVSASKEQQIAALALEREQIANQYQAASDNEFKAEADKVNLMQQKLDEIAAMEQQINDMKLQQPKQPMMAAASVEAPKTQEPSDSCGCEAKIEKVLDEYIKAGKIADKPMKAHNDTMFSQLTPEQMQPMGTNGDGFTDKFDHGFTYLNTSKWAPPVRNIPVCKTEHKCPVCPSLTSGYPVNVFEFDNARKVMPPDNINIDYIRDKLNKSV
jgi:hypothetical protein